MDNKLILNKYRTEESFFTRKSTLGFKTTALLILNRFKESIHISLTKILPTLNLPIVTASAFSQAREKFKFELFKDLADELSNHFLDQVPILYKNLYRLIACDGSTCLVPTSKDVITYFGVHSKSLTGSSTCLAQLVICYDVLSNFVIKSTIGTLKEGEQKLFRTLLPSVKNTGKSLYLLDRGYGYWAMYNQLITLGHDFCVRQSTATSSFSKKVLENPSMDFITEWWPSDDVMKKEEIKIGKPIQVRVTKIVLKSGETELLVSNLMDFELISTKDMGELYYKRWNVEEALKKIKPQMGLENFGSKKIEGIKQEFWATIIQFNIISMIAQEAQIEIDKETEFKKVNKKTPPNTLRKFKYKINWLSATSFVRENYIQLIINKTNMINSVNDLIGKMKLSLCSIRRERSFPRNKTKPKPHKYLNYKS